MMKKLLLFLFLLTATSVFCQDSRIYGTWYLYSLEIDGEIFYSPSNDEVDFVDLVFDEMPTNTLFTNVCNTASGEIIFDSSGYSFSIPEGLGITLLECENPENNTFENLYFDFFLSNEAQPFDFSFVIVNPNNDEELGLSIQASNGDIANYNNYLLANNDYYIGDFSIYPNPVQDKLIIKSSSSISSILKTTIYSIQGKQMISENLKIENEVFIDVSHLSSGMYFINVKNEIGATTTQKFVKF